MEEIETINIAVLLTCYNRREKTLSFLDSLVNQPYYKNLKSDIYLLDDASKDGTTESVKLKYPNVNILAGTGSLFWAGGMRKIWEYALTKNKYDLFLLCNDDVVLYEDAIERLISNYMSLSEKGAILIGSTVNSASKKMSYCGYKLRNIKHLKYYPVTPHEYELIPCHLGNANILLVDALTVERIGIFSKSYTHNLADFDYTLTAVKNGLQVLIAPGYYGYCDNDHGVNWLSGNNTLKKRIEYLYSPKGLAYKEYLYYVKTHFPLDYLSAVIKLWAKTFFPFMWAIFKKKGYNN